MATSTFFNPFNNTSEQNVLDSLVVESIKQYGVDMIYLPRHNKNIDPLYASSDIVEFTDSYEVEMYIRSVDGFSGDGNFLSKFGLEIRDQIVFTVAKKTFDTLVAANAGIVRPREGDLIYFPLNDKCFEIKFADNKPTFYQLGKLQTYNLTCELYEYSSEIFNTGIPEIDRLDNKYSQNIFNYMMLDEEGNTILTEDGDIIEYEDSSANNNNGLNSIFRDNETIQKESDNFISFSETNPFSEGRGP